MKTFTLLLQLLDVRVGLAKDRRDTCHDRETHTGRQTAHYHCQKCSFTVAVSTVIFLFASYHYQLEHLEILHFSIQYHPSSPPPSSYDKKPTMAPQVKRRRRWRSHMQMDTELASWRRERRKRLATAQRTLNQSETPPSPLSSTQPPPPPLPDQPEVEPLVLAMQALGTSNRIQPHVTVQGNVTSQ